MTAKIATHKCKKRSNRWQVSPRIIEKYVSLLFEPDCTYFTHVASKIGSIESSSVRRIFKRGGGGARKFENIENNEDQNENFLPQNQVRFPAQNLVKTQKKRSPLKFSPVFGPKLREGIKKVFPHRFCAHTLCPSYKGRGHAAILHTILC